MSKNRTYSTIVCVGIALICTGCQPIQTRITDDTLTKIALCTGGIGEKVGIEAKVQAEIDTANKKGQGQGTVNYSDLFHGAIFSDPTLASDQKEAMYSKYLTCIDKYSAPTTMVLDISKAHILDESYITKKEGNNTSGLSEIRPRDSYQFDYKTTDQIRIVLLVEVENFRVDGSNTKLEGSVQLINNKKAVALATIPDIYTTSDWLKRPVVVATGPAKVKEFFGYGDDYLGKKIPYLLIIDDFQPNEIIDGENEIRINIDDGLSNQKATKTLHVQFKQTKK